MLLAIDVGNTQTHLGAFRRRRAGRALALSRPCRAPPATRSPSGSPACSRCSGIEPRRGRRDLRLLGRAAARAASTRRWRERYFDARWLVVGPGVKTGMPIRIDNPYEVGADRLVNAVAAYDRFGDACVVVDFGTGINFDAVSADGEYLGGAIAPGVEISLTALTERGAQIGRIELGAARGRDRQVDARRRSSPG